MDRWLRQWPTRWQITVLHALILTVVLGGVGIVVLRQQRAFLVAETRDRLTVETHLVTDGFSNTFTSFAKDGHAVRGDAKFQALLREIPANLASPEVGAAVFQADGSLIVAAKGGPAIPVPDPGTIDKIVLTGDDAVFQAETGADPMLALLVPLPAGGNAVAVAETAVSLRPVAAQIGRLRTYFVAGWVVAVGLSTGLGVPATRRVLRPLVRLVGVTRRVAAGDLTQRVGLPPGRNELAQVAAAFDAMVAQLEASFLAQRRFVADAAHELRTPLTALSASTELLLIGADEADPATTQRLLRHLDRELNRLIRLTNDLLTLSALDAGAPMTLAPTDLSALLEEVGEQTRDMHTGQVLRLAIAPGLRVAANPDCLRQVVLNLLDNARKYTPAGGRITLAAAASDGHVCLTVEDTGIGIPKDALAHLFDRFYRVDSARTRSTGGTGLGLPIVRGLVEAHGGTVAIKSEPNAGTLVLVTLPLLPV
jgi:two-component system OmpR family sensor kinase